ncbi:monocarboxylate transporter 2-like [Gigantopelta aegis]|uniref:monocarboxylate transporter 2-like n=1 Tax=Gigantopelta aegis TaxID=1735272 RepID=UPI001B88A597|nr:monocarboxylate transporter 2-like [Gigantopelta aegis]
MAINVAFNDHTVCEVTSNGGRDETTDDSKTQTRALRTASSDTASKDMVLATTALSICDRSNSKGVRTGQQTNDVDGPWTTESSKRLPENGTCAVENVIVDTENTRWHSKTRLKKQIVLVGICSITIVISHGYAMSLGVLFLPIRDTFGTNTAETALLQSVSLGSLMCGSAVVSPLFLKYGAGPVGFAGNLLATIGLVVSFLAPSFPVLVVSGGFITGLGLCCQYVINFSVIGTVIKNAKWRDFAFALLASSVGIGYSVYPIMTALLLEQFGWRGTMLLLGGITLHCCPAFLTIAAISRDLVQKDRKLDDPSESKSHWNLSLFKEFGFLIMGFNVFLVLALIPTVNFFLVDMSKTNGFDLKTGAFFLTVAGISSVAGRAITVAVTVFTGGSKILPIGVLYIATGTFMSIVPFAKTYVSVVSAVLLYNIPYGASSVLFPSAVYEVAGNHRYTSAVGYAGLIGGVAAWISGPIGGELNNN